MDIIWKDNNIFYNVLCFLITENEKFFDRSDAKLYWQTVFHMFGIFHHNYVGLFSIHLDLDSSNCDDIKTVRNFRSAYLTLWNFVFQTVFFSLSLCYDLLQWTDKHETKIGKKLKYYRDILFSAAVVPFTMFITTMFWSVYWIDRELVFPKVFDEVLPWWLNHCVHTNILLAVIIETILTARRKPRDGKTELTIFAVIAVAYAIVYYSIYFFAHRWLYQVFGIMTWWQVCLYQLLIWGSSYCFYRIQFPINRLIHGTENCDQNNIKKVIQDRSEEKQQNGIDHNNVKDQSEENQHQNGIDHNKAKNQSEENQHQNGIDHNKAKYQSDCKNEELSNGEKADHLDKGKQQSGVDRKKDKDQSDNPCKNGEKTDHTNKEVKEKDKNGDMKNGIHKNGNEKASPILSKTWSTKFQKIRNQFENTSL